MNKGIKSWIIAITIGVLLFILAFISCVFLLTKIYKNKNDRQNESIQSYTDNIVEETTTEVESTEEETTVKDYGIEVEEVTTEYEYVDSEYDNVLAYFPDSSKLDGELLPYDILGPLTNFLTDKLHEYDDKTREMIIDDVSKSDLTSEIIFHTEKGKYNYRYYWESNTQELIKVE